VIYVSCDGCGISAKAIWNYRAKRWRIPSEWEPYVIYDLVSEVFQHACSPKCHVELVEKLPKRSQKPVLRIVR